MAKVTGNASVDRLTEVNPIRTTITETIFKVHALRDPFDLHCNGFPFTVPTEPHTSIKYFGLVSA